MDGLCNVTAQHFASAKSLLLMFKGLRREGAGVVRGGTCVITVEGRVSTPLQSHLMECCQCENRG